MKNVAQIAIDGPVASGKSVVGLNLARRLSYRFLDTGLMYRALTLVVLEANVNPEDHERVVELAKNRVIEVVFGDNGDASVQVEGHDITSQLSDAEIDRTVSLVAQVPGAREVLVEQQRRVAREGHIVVAGRDIGTVVLPNAPLKVFLTASSTERAQRRHLEFQRTGRDVTYNQVLRDIEERDRLDSGRSIAPLRPASDAHITITDRIGIEEVVEGILKLMERS